jgi:dephospho-CoA kinase
VLVVGLTGGIATGKSTVARILAKRGVPVVDADGVARAVVEPGAGVLERLVVAFAPTPILSASGGLDRAKMRALISENPEQRALLNRIVHPAIGAAVARRLAELAESGQRSAVVEAALMVETGSYRAYPVVLVVTCGPDEQLKRLIDRDGGSRESALALIATQLPLSEKEAAATHLIRNDAGLAELHARTLEVWDEIITASGQPEAGS